MLLFADQIHRATKFLYRRELVCRWFAVIGAQHIFDSKTGKTECLSGKRSPGNHFLKSVGLGPLLILTLIYRFK